MSRTSVLRMVKSRTEEAGFDPSRVCCHTFRGTGITAYLENGGKLEVAQHIAGHADASTTKLYDRRRELVSKEGWRKSGFRGSYLEAAIHLPPDLGPGPRPAATGR